MVGAAHACGFGLHTTREVGVRRTHCLVAGRWVQLCAVGLANCAKEQAEAWKEAASEEGEDLAFVTSAAVVPAFVRESCVQGEPQWL